MHGLDVADMRMEDPIPTFSYVVQQLKERYPNLAYVHAVGPGAPLNRGPEDESVSMTFRGLHDDRCRY